MKRNDLGPMAVDRRDFLEFTGGGIAVAIILKDVSPIPEAMAQQRAYPTDPNAYVLVREYGRVRIFSGKIEMGQGVLTSQAQMAAEELRVSRDQVDMVPGDTDLCPWDAGTWGSLTTRHAAGPPPAPPGPRRHAHQRGYVRRRGGARNGGGEPGRSRR